MSEARRDPVNYRYDALNWDFLRMMAQIAHYAEGKYGRAENYVDSDLAGEKSPVNHMCEHLRSYMRADDHDHFDGPEWHLAVIAYNAMMEFYYFGQRGRDRGELYQPAPWAPALTFERASIGDHVDEAPIDISPPPLEPSLFDTLFGRMGKKS